MKIKIEQIHMNEGRRVPRPEDVQALADSIHEIGLMNPVTVTANHTLVAGLHRVEAAKLLGWDEIECTVLETDELHAELAEIDENYVRANLTPLESGRLLLRRKQIYETLHPETKAGIAQAAAMHREDSDPVADKLSATGEMGTAKPFAEDTAEKLGVDARTVRRKVQIAKDLDPEVQEILDKAGVQLTQQDLLKLSRMEPGEQKEVADGLIGNKIRSLSDYFQRKKWAETAAKAETRVIEDPNLPFKVEMKHFRNFEESLADMKSEKPPVNADMFMADITRYMDDFCKGFALYYDPGYARVFPDITKEQLVFLRERSETVCSALNAFLGCVENQAVIDEKKEEENE